MTISRDEPGTHTERSNVAELAARLLARSNAAVHHQCPARLGVDTISQARYRDANELEDGHLGDVPSDSESCAIAGVASAVGRHVDLAEQLRQAIRRSGLTRNQIAKRTDLSYAIVHGFVAGTKDLRLATASKIAAIVGVELRPLDAARRRR